MTKNYVFYGDFLPMVKARPSNGRSFDEHMASKIKLEHIIESQHGKDDRFKGNLHMRVVFYTPMPDGISQKRREKGDGMYYNCRPAIGCFVKALELAIADIILSESAVVVSVEAEKRRSIEPRVEFILSEIE